MYLYSDDVETLLVDFAKTYGIKGKSLTFYTSRINKFFSEYMGLPPANKPLNAITFFDINTYLANLNYSNAEKVNHYNSLKRFFEYTYLTNTTKEIMSQVIKPLYSKKPKKVLGMDEYIKLKKFIFCKSNNLNDRLILGLFLFTGLSRKYIASIRNNQFTYDDGVYKLIIWKGEEEIKLPLKAELQLIIHEYCTNKTESQKMENAVKMNEDYISKYIANLTKTISGKKYTPTILSNTFISMALKNGNYIWEVSKLTLESAFTIEQHVINIENLVNKQTAILNSF